MLTTQTVMDSKEAPSPHFPHLNSSLSSDTSVAETHSPFSHTAGSSARLRISDDRVTYKSTSSRPTENKTGDVSSEPYTANWSPLLVFVLSCLSVAAASLGGNAVRFAMESGFVKLYFFTKYNYILPNTIGCFFMGLLVTILPPEGFLPLTYRACCVGFCGSLTTFSTWMVKVMTQNTASDAFEHLFIGATMPVVFFLWGRDLGRLLRWCSAEWLRCPWESWTAHRCVLRAVDATVFALLVVAAVLAPVLVQVYVNRGRVRVISTDDIRMVVLAPAGAVVRFSVSTALNNKKSVRCFPLGTLLLNLSSLALAFVMVNMSVVHPSNDWFSIVQQGICGTLSTISTLLSEVFIFYAQKRIAFVYVYLLATVGGCALIGGIGRPQIYHRTMS